MEKIAENRKEVLDFLRIAKCPNGFGDDSGDGICSCSAYDYGDGFGYGSGDGFGYIDGYGYGSSPICGSSFGSGYGEGFSYGSGDSYGSGYGYGSCDNKSIEVFNDMVVHKIDGLPTLIDSVHGNFAKGCILSHDLTTKPCFIVKIGNYFAHGESLKQAFIDATEKSIKNQPIEERIAQFNTVYPNRNVKIPACELFSWHHILTGSCLMGRKQFCEERGLDYKNGKYTVNEFIQLTKNAYGGYIIRQLESSL